MRPTRHPWRRLREFRHVGPRLQQRRESFRPFAPSILREKVSEWFEQDDEVPFMMQVYPIRAEQRSRIPAVTHADGSARGDVVGLLHSDDLFAHDRVLERIAAIFADPAVDVAYGDLDYVSRNDTGRVIRRWRSGEFSPRKLAWGWMPPHPTLFARRGIYEQVGGFDTSFRIAADYDLILRMLGGADVQPKYIPEVLVKMRLGGESNRSLGHILRKSLEDYRALRRNGVGGLGALCWKNLSKLGQFF